ncbi:MAG: prolyl oligopeptidase family serine peptidase, partial [Myxococcaceae bacterium]|nr:prolyl oligopeptidase family serine peptidase [Myxococcaceae bacterium]
DAGKEAALLLAMDASTGKELARYTERKPANAEVAGVSVSKKGDRLALGLLAGNHQEVRLLHARTLKPAAKVQLPLGRGFPRDFSDDGRRLTLTWSSPGTPTDVFAIDSRTGKVSPLRSDARPTLKGLPVIETSLAEVKGFDGTVIPVHVYRQKGDKGTRRPVIVSYHGGPAGTATIGWSPMAAFFVSQGYVWVEPNVRGSGGFGRAFEEADNGPRRLDAFKDIEASSRWAASQPWADKDRVVIYGGSYGGYTTLIGLTRFPELYRAGVNLFGVANLKTFMASTSGLIREVFHLEFGHPEKDAAFLDSISPLKDTGKIQDPLFVYAGANDPRVPRAESDLIVSAVRRSKVPVEYMVKDNEGHSLARRENQMEFYARMARFLQTHLASANAPDTQAQQSQ